MSLEALSSSIISAWQGMSGWEVCAVLLAIAYVLLAVKERIECWYAAFASSAIFLVLFWNVSLLMESALQVYYMGMALYGLSQWRLHANSEQDLQIHTWPPNRHALWLATILLVTLVSGYLLSNNTDAARPYLDSFTTWASVFTTWLVARKVLENWLYWIVIDAVSIFLYVDRGLYLTAVLFIVYVIIAAFGFLHWQQRYNARTVPCPATT
ncbi:MAG: nicotinamide riboside transporter PnuC [Pseudomonadales bacterium]